MTKILATGAVAVAGLMVGMAAQAHGGVSLSIGVGVPGVVVGAPAPVYMPPLLYMLRLPAPSTMRHPLRSTTSLVPSTALCRSM